MWVRKKIIHAYSVGGFPLEIRKGKGLRGYIVRYGAQVHANLTWQEASTKYGEALFHGLELEGKLDRS